jgi:aryl-alcohol dehydrogenase-like predicted oxidoreductase
MARERAARLPENDWRRRDPEFNEPKLSQNLALVERLRAIGARHGRSPGEVAIAWVLGNPAVTGAIVGAHSPQQAEQIMRAGSLRLPGKEMEEIEATFPSGEEMRNAMAA